MDWDCAEDECRHVHGNGRSVFVVRGSRLTSVLFDTGNASRILRPEDVFVVCLDGYRFVPSLSVATFEDPATGVRPTVYPDHSVHCMSCDEWCGENGSCVGDFQCLCNAGFGGERCNAATDTFVGRPLVVSQTNQPTTAILVSRLAYQVDLVAGTSGLGGAIVDAPDDAFRLQACTSHTDCLDSGTERCMIHLELSRQRGALAYACFCRVGSLPSASSNRCVPPAVVGGHIWQQSVLGPPSAPLSRQERETDVSTLRTGPIGSLFLQQSSLGKAGVVLTSIGDVQLQPVFLDCGGAGAGGGGTFSRTRDPSRWCAAFTPAECAVKGLVVSEDGFRCTCRNTSLVPDVCNETVTACRERRCSNRGACQPTGCVCDDGWAGTTCDAGSIACGALWCNGRGVCGEPNPSTANPTCVCDSGWFGDTCSMSATECNRLFCGDTGSCDPLTTACTCSWQYAGTACERRNCLNGGLWTGTTCRCTVDWTGANCERAICGDGGRIGPSGDCVCGAAFGPDSITGSSCGRHLCSPGTPIDLDRCTCPSTWTSAEDGNRYCAKMLTATVPSDRSTRAVDPPMDGDTARAFLYPIAVIAVFIQVVVFYRIKV
jgi:hypothetical protein